MPTFADMRDKNGFERFLRILEFGKLCGQSLALCEQENRILAAKREALTSLQRILPQGKLTWENTLNTLHSAAMSGNLHAMTALSYLEYHGIGMDADPRRAKKRIAAAARWNDLFANLMGIAYDREQLLTYHDRLYTLLLHRGMSVFACIAAHRPAPRLAEKDPVAALLEKAFAMQIVKADCYDRSYGRVAFSGMISVQDKEKLLLSGKKDSLGALCDLPFDARMTSFGFDGTATQELGTRRQEELDKILRNLTVASACPHGAKPLLLQCADTYLAARYNDLFCRIFANAPLFTVDAGSLGERDFARGQEHILLRGLSQTKSCRTVFLITHAEKLTAESARSLGELLEPSARSCFRLFSPSVSFDLSGVQFILIGEQRGAALQMLLELCDTVQVLPASAEEKERVLQELFAKGQSRFGCDRLKLDGECKQFLLHYDLEKVQQLLDGAFGMALYRGQDTVTLPMVQQIAEEKRITAQKRSFGYTGGNYAKN